MLKVEFRIIFEVKEKKKPSLCSRWRAELEDLSLLEGIELAAMELVACSCIFFCTQKQVWYVCMKNYLTLPEKN